MSKLRIFALVLIVAGMFGLAIGSLRYTKETHKAKLGVIELSVKDRETVNIPVWAGVGTILIGGGMFAYPFIRKANSSKNITEG